MFQYVAPNVSLCADESNTRSSSSPVHGIVVTPRVRYNHMGEGFFVRLYPPRQHLLVDCHRLLGVLDRRVADETDRREEK